MLYIEKLEKKTMRPAGDSDIKIVYSPLHGTGYKIVPRVLSHFGFKKVIPVKEQSVPDENFSTVKSPNPEERAALEMALDLARRENADIIMATDPDADRMGIGFKDESGEYLLINGNQIGTMLEYYLLSRLSLERKLPPGATVIKTVVTTDLQEEIAKSFGCEMENVLTGFKWIALKMREYDETGSRSFVFGGEESYGYLPVDFVRDKDAVSACYFFAEMADWLKSRGMGLNDFLNEIYIKHHLYLEDLHSLTLKGMEGMEKIGAIMNALRKNPPKEFASLAVTLPERPESADNEGHEDRLRASDGGPAGLRRAPVFPRRRKQDHHEAVGYGTQDQVLFQREEKDGKERAGRGEERTEEPDRSNEKKPDG